MARLFPVGLLVGALLIGCHHPTAKPVGTFVMVSGDLLTKHPSIQVTQTTMKNGNWTSKTVPVQANYAQTILSSPNGGWTVQRSLEVPDRKLRNTVLRAEKHYEVVADNTLLLTEPGKPTEKVGYDFDGQTLVLHPLSGKDETYRLR